jgi:hypothetical protein
MANGSTVRPSGPEHRPTKPVTHRRETVFLGGGTDRKVELHACLDDCMVVFRADNRKPRTDFRPFGRHCCLIRKTSGVRCPTQCFFEQCREQSCGYRSPRCFTAVGLVLGIILILVFTSVVQYLTEVAGLQCERLYKHLQPGRSVGHTLNTQV